jgi:hypothetical protein
MENNMKKALVVTLAVLSLQAHAESDVIKWGAKDGTKQKMSIDGSFLCPQGKTLVIDGVVEIAHPKENIMAAKPQRLLIKCETVHFTPGSKLFTLSSLNLMIQKKISGDINIQSARGVNGGEGTIGKPITEKALIGLSGSNGNSGKGADCATGKSAQDGASGNFAQHGQTGRDGNTGSEGLEGTHASSIRLDVAEIEEGSSLYISSLGGSGGQGGTGGRGQDGADGGIGGSGGSGGSTDAVCVWAQAGNGGRGGNGGHGGNGGNGGSGGKGGRGGNGGRVEIWISKPLPSLANKDIDANGGRGGDGGFGGSFGEGGKGGEGGSGGRKGYSVTNNGSSGSDGVKGTDGVRGMIGPMGAQGGDGLNGEIIQPSIVIYYPRPDSDFADLPETENEASIINKIKLY